MKRCYVDAGGVGQRGSQQAPLLLEKKTQKTADLIAHQQLTESFFGSFWSQKEQLA
ncbi:MAG: hypothetical protein H7251_03630 [Acetobacteraceae bacterium]|nr:hypothetical protein [Acetobacteraceae bacterium]